MELSGSFPKGDGMLFKRSAKETPEKKIGLFERMKKALVATKENLVSKIEAVLSSRTAIDEEALDELEGTLLGADLGVRVTERIMNAIRQQYKKDLIKTPEDAKNEIRTQLLSILSPPSVSEEQDSKGGVQVWMVVGVNGTGKTTTVGKLAARLSGEGKKVLVCAADTFRPAAIEQLTVWAERSGADLIKSKIGRGPFCRASRRVVCGFGPQQRCRPGGYGGAVAYQEPPDAGAGEDAPRGGPQDPGCAARSAAGCRCNHRAERTRSSA